MPSDAADDWLARRDRIIGLGERSFHKSYYPQLRQNIDRLERFRTLLDHTSDFVVLLALPEGLIADANSALGRLLGVPIEALIGRPFASLGIAEAPAMLETMCRDVPDVPSGGDTPSCVEIVEFGPRDARLWLELSYSVAVVDKRCYGVLVGRDVSERKAAEERAAYLAYYDVLTGLPNRSLVQDRMLQAAAVADASGSKVALLMVDLDRFKTINDSLGHSVGDQLLVEVAKRLKLCLRENDTLCRQGGDEFLILLPGLRDAEACVTHLATLTEGLAQPFSLNARELMVTVSMGIAIYPDDGTDLGTLLKEADMAMFRAKDAGRNTYRFFNEEMNEEAEERLAMHFNLRRALDAGQFMLHYQPQIEIASGLLVGAEALLRWNHPDLGLVPPARFIPQAEESGLIVPIGEWVLREACREAASWQRQGMRDVVVAVNLSALQFRRGDIEASVTRALDESGLDPALLELELTESILIHDTEKVLATVMRLKHMGIRLSIDDFGTGYSSLAYLKRFRVDKLKIDQSFIRDLASNPDDAAIVRAVIQMARSLGLRTIAEGVESQHVLDHLRLYRCDEAQGYLLSQPVPVADFVAAYCQARATS